MLVHTVLFNLKPGMSEEEKTAFEADVTAMEEIEAVRTLHLGKPANTPKRDVIQRDFDYKLTVLFDSVENHNIYQDHLLHQEFVTNQKPFFEKVRVFDSE